MLETGEERGLLARYLKVSNAKSEARLEAGSRGDDSPLDYERTVTAVLGNLAAQRERRERECSDLPALYEELLAHTPEHRCIVIRNRRRYWSWALCDLLLEESSQALFRQPSDAVHLAELAIEVAERMDSSDLSTALVADLKGRSWTQLALAQRNTGEFRTAEESFRVAEALLAQGTGDLLEEARLSSSLGGLRGDQGRYEESFALLDRAAAIYRHYGEDHRLGKVLIRRGIFVGRSDGPAEALPHFERALGLVDAKLEPRLVVAAIHNRIFSLNELGRHAEAAELLEQHRPLYEALGDRISLLRVRWIEGRIALGFGRTDEAESTLLEIRSAFLTESMPLDAALASLELASIYVKQSRTAEIKELTADILPLFKASEMYREALAAMILFQNAAQMEGVTLGLIRDAMAKLRRLRNER